MQPYGRVEDPLAGFCGDSGEPLHYITRKHFYEQMKARQDVPVNEMARFGIDIFASLRSTYHIAWTFNYDFFLSTCYLHFSIISLCLLKYLHSKINPHNIICGESG